MPRQPDNKLGHPADLAAILTVYRHQRHPHPVLVAHDLAPRGQLARVGEAGPPAGV